MDSRIWHRRPASEWKEGLPIGNGILGGMVMGGVHTERIGLNQEWLWRAKGRFRTTQLQKQFLPQIRSLFFEGKLIEAGELANEKFGGLGGVSDTPCRVDPFQPAGDLLLYFSHGAPSDYRRELDFGTAVASVRYEADGSAFEREVFVHSSFPVLCLRQTCSEPGGLDVCIALDRIQDPDCDLTISLDGSRLQMTGAFPEGPRFCVLADVFPQGGDTGQCGDGTSLRVRGTKEMVILLTIAVTHDGEDAVAQARVQLDGVPTDWNALRDGHVAAHSELYERVTLDLGDVRDDVPTEERIAALREGADDNGLMALYFNYGRYLLISSSRPGGLPANDQGVWNEELKPPWNSDLHHDVNLQMNYWLAEVCNLPECAEPLFDHMERLVPHAREMARDLYGCDGICFPLQTDPWGGAAAEGLGWDVWTGGAAWLAQHMWWRYEYSHDERFLREHGYPFFKEVAAF